MQKLTINQTKNIKATIHVPGDKSISHRAIMLGAIAKGKTVVENFLMSADCLATIECFRKMGVEIQMPNAECLMPNEGKIIIKGKGLKGLKRPEGILDVGNSGTTMRLMTGILAGQGFTSEITGDKSIQKRPMGRVAVPLQQMGADFGSEGEIFAPFKVFGRKLKGMTYELPVASAQVKSAILLAGLYADGETTVIEKITSRDHTERMLEHFGLRISKTGNEIRVTGNEEFSGAEVDVPGDISSAAFFMVAGLLIPNSEIKIMNVGVNPTRTGIIDVLHRMGANIEVQNERIISGEPRADIIVRTSELGAIKIDGEIIPRIIDEIPIIAVAATQAQGVTEIRGAKELRVKESDRIKTVAAELRKFGAQIEELGDGLRIYGTTTLKGSTIQSYGDHRIAMAMSIAGLVATGKTVIEETECVETSFPGFEELLTSLV
ncbi:MAG: 3-phosphoshikimate 1-carboxyvinyltransferase [bacterium]